MIVYQLDVSLDVLAIGILCHKVVRQIYDMFVEIGVLGFSLDTEFPSGTSLRLTVLQIGLTMSVGYTVHHVQFTVQVAGNVMTIGQEYIEVTGHDAVTELAVQFTLGVGFQFLVDELDFVPGEISFHGKSQFSNARLDSILEYYLRLSPKQLLYSLRIKRVRVDLIVGFNVQLLGVVLLEIKVNIQQNVVRGILTGHTSLQLELTIQLGDIDDNVTGTLAAGGFELTLGVHQVRNEHTQSAGRVSTTYTLDDNVHDIVAADGDLAVLVKFLQVGDEGSAHLDGLGFLGYFDDQISANVDVVGFHVMGDGTVDRVLLAADLQRVGNVGFLADNVTFGFQFHFVVHHLHFEVDVVIAELFGGQFSVQFGFKFELVVAEDEIVFDVFVGGVQVQFAFKAQ